MIIETNQVSVSNDAARTFASVISVEDIISAIKSGERILVHIVPDSSEGGAVIIPNKFTATEEYLSLLSFEEGNNPTFKFSRNLLAFCASEPALKALYGDSVQGHSDGGKLVISVPYTFEEATF